MFSVVIEVRMSITERKRCLHEDFDQSLYQETFMSTYVQVNVHIVAAKLFVSDCCKSL